MSTPGWYLDPAGGGGHRWWDGRAWTAKTSHRTGPPSGTSSAGGGRDAGNGRDPGSGRGPWGWILGGLALVVAIVVAIGWVLTRPSGPREITDGDYPTASSTVSSWNDGQPQDTASPTPTPDPTPSDTPPASAVPCPQGDPNQRQSHPNDVDRVYGGNLAFTRQADFDRPRPEPRFTIAHDVTQQVRSVAPADQWIAQLAVGRLRGSDGFTGSAQAVGTALAQCTASSEMYTPYEQELRITDSAAITVAGPSGATAAGWRVDADIRVDQGPSFGGDKVVFVVVPDGKDWGMFFGAVPLGDPTMAARLDGVVGSLRTT